MDELRLTSRNTAFQRFEAVKRGREKRAKLDLCFVEGANPIERAVDFGWEFADVGYSDGRRLSGWARDMIARAKPERLFAMSAELHAELSDRTEPCELIALVRTRELAADELPEGSLFVAFDRPTSPGNLGTVIRSADAFGARALITTGHSADFYDPQCVRASVGTLFAMPFCALEGASEAAQWARGRGLQVIGTSAHGATPLDRVDFSRPTLLAIGNETFGLSKAWKEMCDELAVMPICGAASSLNAGCAATACLYEIARQRRFAR